MAYKEPGSYSRLINERQYAVGTTTSLIPYFIGTGAKVLSKTEVVTRSSDEDFDILEREALEILMVGKSIGKAGYTQAPESEAIETMMARDAGESELETEGPGETEDPKDPDAPETPEGPKDPETPEAPETPEGEDGEDGEDGEVVDPENPEGEGGNTDPDEEEPKEEIEGDFTHEGDKIIWLDTDNKPEAGDQYYVTYTYEVGDEQFEPRLIEPEHLEDFFGGEIREFEVDPETGEAPINRLVVAANIAFTEGADMVFVHQVKEEEGKALHQSYKDALNEHTLFIDSVYRIVPVDSGKEINDVIDAHVEICSTYEERKERTAIYSVPGAEECETADEVLDKIGGYAAAKKFKRVAVPYPCMGTRVLSDGKEYVLDGPFMAAALAGRENANPVHLSLTRSRLRSFNEIIGAKMTRTQKNKLAEKGVLIVEQPHGPGTNCVVRHQLTTDYPQIQHREMSVVRIQDYVSKRIREVTDNYVGPYNVTGETITRVQSAIEGEFNDLVKSRVIIRGEIVEIKQDEWNPDTILVTIRIYVPYPCNYIDITILSV